ncbi:MAG: GNAT family N-acetyltransferase [Actinomycetota bacterium]|nr:GNAT family N-acetyltransferase [Actinomycetota bacterium]
MAAPVGEIVVEELVNVTPDVVAAFERLIPQLSRSSPAPGPEVLAELAEAPGTVVLLARKRGGEGGVIGSLTLVLFRIPTGLRAWIEDVVVDEEARGCGVGDALNRAALDIARARGCKTVDLTSRPSREAANRLYQRLGFTRRDTNVYRYDLEG